MVTIVIDPSADLPDVASARDQLFEAICGQPHVEGVQVELSSGEAPRHLVLQLLASAAASRPSSKSKVVFGPIAAAVVERMEFREGGAA